MRWANFLSRFNFHIAHIAGKHNQVADALSRRPKVNAVSIATHNDLSSMIDEYAIDPDFKDVISAIALGKKEEPFTLQDGYLLHGNKLCITRSLREKVMFESHAPPYAGHRGIQTTMKAIETYFYWPTMKGDIQDYVSKCVGLPLPILDSPWESISMDFIFRLPKSIHGNTRIWTIVDGFSKQAHFILVKKTIKAHQMATLFISQVFKYHGLPTSIVSDSDPRMTNNFSKALFENLGTRLNFSSAYHPQTDGQSEIANLTVLDLLKAYVTEVDQRSQWEKYLPLVEYAYNNNVHTSTRKAPFKVIEGRPKSPLLLKVHGKIFAADEYSRNLKESFQKIKEAISIAQQKQKATANKHRRALAFKENDWVLLKFPKARLRHTTGKNPTGHQKYYAKLAKRYYGPFQILKPINEMAYQLKLPKHWLIHNAFHVSLLKPYKGEPPKEAIMQDPPEVEGQEVLQPESVLRHEDKVLRNGKIIRRYLIKFKNYPFEDAKWMQGTQLKDSLHLVNAYNDSLEAWGKVRDQEVLVFFDPGAHANFISPELASKLGIRAEEMRMTGEAGLACLGHSEAVIPILGKLRLHIQNYVDAKEFHIMSLQDCDVLLSIPWCYRLHAVEDTFHKKITLVHRGKIHVLDVKLKGELVPVVSASAISSVIKNHLSAYLVFAKEVHEVEKIR
ncbi:hypothetical protein L7F22_067361 [Adiantum nelumboides]|nr:hypothetical protein [Adiantum nelumboides]